MAKRGIRSKANNRNRRGIEWEWEHCDEVFSRGLRIKASCGEILGNLRWIRSAMPFIITFPSPIICECASLSHSCLYRMRSFTSPSSTFQFLEYETVVEVLLRVIGIFMEAALREEKGLNRDENVCLYLGCLTLVQMCGGAEIKCKERLGELGVMAVSSSTIFL